MNPILRNILAVIAGIVLGSVVNMGIITVAPLIFPYPDGYSNSDTESIKAGWQLLSTSHILIPFFAHAIGTLVGAFFTSIIAANHKMKFAIGIGIWFLIGGITAVMMFGGPLWFKLLDLIVAYIPMALVSGLIGRMIQAKQ